MKFDYCNKKELKPQALTREIFEQIIDSQWLQQTCAEIAGGNLAKKGELPGITWQASFNGQSRSNKNAIPSGLFQLDVDHCNPDEIWARISNRIDELGIYVAHKTASREGIRIVAKCRPEFSTLIDNQLWLSEQIQVQPDTACKDFARIGFICERSYFYHYNPSIFTDTPSTLISQPSTLNPQPSTLNQESLNPQPSTLNLSH